MTEIEILFQTNKNIKNSIFTIFNQTYLINIKISICEFFQVTKYKNTSLNQEFKNKFKIPSKSNYQMKNNLPFNQNLN